MPILDAYTPLKTVDFGGNFRCREIDAFRDSNHHWKQSIVVPILFLETDGRTNERTDERTDGRNYGWPGKYDTFFKETGTGWAHFEHILALSAGRVFARLKSCVLYGDWASKWDSGVWPYRDASASRFQARIFFFGECFYFWRSILYADLMGSTIEPIKSAYKNNEPRIKCPLY